MAERQRKRYRVVAITLHDQEVNEADRCAGVLQRAGWPRANRSLVVREALHRLQDDLAGRDDERVFRYFVERYARRVGGVARRESSEERQEAPARAERSPDSTATDVSAGLRKA
jgi:hypothetical protein